jgi:hypothetical protein
MHNAIALPSEVPGVLQRGRRGFVKVYWAENSAEWLRHTFTLLDSSFHLDSQSFDEASE